MIKRLLIILFALGFISCNSESDSTLQFTEKNRTVPAFNADSAYAQVLRQVEMGPRNPGSEGHKRTKEYLIKKLETYAGSSVFAQRFTHRGYEGDTLHMANIIAAFNTRSSARIMLSAHWDTRPRGEQDTDAPGQPIPGADDGASGVAVLLELARIFSENPPPIGVDIVLFDGEDYGKEGDMAQYFLGSRYWANNPPVQGYQPRFGILLDMVGGRGARFYKEGHSMQFAPALMNEVWAIAEQQGYGDLFISERTSPINDDHVVVNRVSKIPMIDIIRHEPGDGESITFAPYWHTQNDDMTIISREVMQAVGEVLTELIYNRL